jgi:alkylation response protein AidB-like acyl-CoA dehydrogenase
MHAVLAVEELARVDPAVAVLVDVQNTLVVNALLRWGNGEQAARWLPPLSASLVGAYALSESGAGSDAFALRLTAGLEGDSYVLDGHKLWITNAAEAGLFIVFATIDPSRGYKGVTAFLVERDTPGLTIGRKEDKLGIRASSTCELRFERCRVPASHLLGEPGQGYRIAIETLNEGRIGIGAQMIGLASGALDLAIAHVRTREQFGQRIADFQGVQFQIARAATDVEAARLLVYAAARRCDAGAPVVTSSAMAKLFASETAERVASLALNLCGGAGFVKDHPIEKLYRDAKIGQIYEGTSNMQLLTIAKQLLRG